MHDIQKDFGGVPWQLACFMQSEKLPMFESQPAAVQVLIPDARMQERRCRSQPPLGTNTAPEDTTMRVQ